MRIAEADILIVPGGDMPDANHWQRRWGSRFSTAQFVTPDDWNRSGAGLWLETIERTIMMATRPVVLIAHSAGVYATVHAAARLADTKVRGAFLVAPPDVEQKRKVPGEMVFPPLPRDPLPFPSMLVASSSDAFCTIERAVEFATSWGSDFHVAGDAGHIDAVSGHGPWPEGLLMFTRLMQRLRG